MRTSTTSQVIDLATGSLKKYISWPDYKGGRLQEWLASQTERYMGLLQPNRSGSYSNYFNIRKSIAKPDITNREIIVVARELLDNIARAENTVPSELLHYTYFRPEGKSYVVIKAGKKIRTLNQLTKLPGLYDSGLVRRPPFGREAIYKHIVPGKEAEFYNITKIMFHLVDSAFLQGILSAGKPLDLSRGLLPDSDEKFRVSNVHMLYDSYDKEWRVWTKN